MSKESHSSYDEFAALLRPALSYVKYLAKELDAANAKAEKWEKMYWKLWTSDEADPERADKYIAKLEEAAVISKKALEAAYAILSQLPGDDLGPVKKSRQLIMVAEAMIAAADEYKTMTVAQDAAEAQ